MQNSKPKKKKIIKGIAKVIAFTTIILLILSVFSYALNPRRFADSSVAYEREQYLSALLREPSDTIDVVILGDSESFGLLSPMHLWKNKGIASYIGGQGGLRTVEGYYSLKKILEKQKPKLVILETNNVFDVMGKLEEIKYDATTIFYHYFPVIKYHGLWKNYVDNDIMNQKHYNGFEIRTNVAPYQPDEDYLQYTQEVEPIDSLLEYYFTKTIELCKSENIQVLLVSATAPQHFTYKRHNAMEEYAKKLEVPFIDMNVIKELNISLTEDMLDGGDHVNVYGSLKMTEYMEKYLTENYDLPDRRGDERYKEWDERAKSFFEELSAN